MAPSTPYKEVLIGRPEIDKRDTKFSQFYSRTGVVNELIGSVKAAEAWGEELRDLHVARGGQ